ncbi:MAG: hypothetical protein ACNA7Z_06940 [Dethiobacteria bacterium]|nr:hypothetical protein [Bacillota bacterium]
MIFIDTDIFVIDLRYQRDKKYETNKRFLEVTRKGSIGTTSIYNILEVCGILSFNLNEQQLLDLYYHLPRRYNLQGITLMKPDQRLPSFRIRSIINVFTRKSSFGDALIICAAADRSSELNYFVSWNAEHFKDKLTLSVLTPAEYLKAL